MFYTHFKKMALLGILFLFSFLFFYFHLTDYLNLKTFKAYQAIIQQWTMMHYLSAVCIYLFVYCFMIACAIPCATIFALLGGFLFGSIAIFYAVFSTTLGGLILFLATRTALGHYLTKKSTGWLKKMEVGFQKNAFHYLLTLRLVPIFPCWISNITAGILNVPLSTFISATIIGIFPATFIYVMMGRGLDKFLLIENINLAVMIRTPAIIFPLLGLSLFSLFPLLYKNVKKQPW
ncbi:MAG: VTT domain-containing protein [Gammaproteobacteria bacterium]|nr:VTT domain-containing protein [Gammaproteobacteria bacterium]